MKHLIFWSKTDIASAVNLRAERIADVLTESTKQSVGWRKGKQYFKQNQVFEIMKDLNPHWKDDFIEAMINPNLNKQARK